MAIARSRKAPPPLEPVSPSKRLFTVHEYHKMGEAGILTEDDRVELIEGELIVMPPIGPEHAGSVDRLGDLLRALLGPTVIVRGQNPLRLGLRSEPEPDLAVVPHRADYYRSAHPEPSDTLLVIEIAESSLTYDRKTKARLYAKAAIQEYWIVDLIHGEIVVHRDPSRTRYRDVRSVISGDNIAPLAFPEVSLAVADLLG